MTFETGKTGGPVRAASKSSRGDLKLLLAEVVQYVDQVRTHLAGPSLKTREELRHKLAYIATLTLTVRNQVYDLEAETRTDEHGRRYFHGVASIASRLHRIAELALNVVRQFGHLSRQDFMDDYGLDEFFEEIGLGLSLIRPALEQRKVKLVVRLCQVEGHLDALYADRFQRLIRELDQGCGQPGDRVTALMVVHYLERIGDLLLEIGELMIHIFFGENLNFAQYQALGAGLKAAGREAKVWERTNSNPAEPYEYHHRPDGAWPLWGEDAAAFQSIWGGRSGCRIGIVGLDDEEVGRVDGQPVIFKHGPAAKLEKERENLEIWAELWPGLPPAVKTFVPGQNEGEAALVMEYISGHTLRDVFMDPGRSDALAELTGALNLMAGIWRETRREEPVRAGFIRQAEKRLGPIRALYPDLLDFQGSVGRLRLKSVEELLAEARVRERDLAAPFSVRVHGDFNLSNVMRDEADGRIRFIDLYRSRQSDYVQDLSVMILSILRLPLTGREDRDRLSKAAVLVKKFALDFASASGDPTCEARLAFGLARSYLTSARFEPRRSAAARFIGYTRHLLGQLIDFGRSGRPWAEFKLDKSALYIL